MFCSTWVQTTSGAYGQKNSLRSTKEQHAFSKTQRHASKQRLSFRVGNWAKSKKEEKPAWARANQSTRDRINFSWCPWTKHFEEYTKHFGKHMRGPPNKKARKQSKTLFQGEMGAKNRKEEGPAWAMANWLTRQDWFCLALKILVVGNKNLLVNLLLVNLLL